MNWVVGERVCVLHSDTKRAGFYWDTLTPAEFSGYSHGVAKHFF
jgi:hypothetical protein